MATDGPASFCGLYDDAYAVEMHDALVRNGSVTIYAAEGIALGMPLGTLSRWVSKEDWRAWRKKNGRREATNIWLQLTGAKRKARMFFDEVNSGDDRHGFRIRLGAVVQQVTEGDAGIDSFGEGEPLRTLDVMRITLSGDPRSASPPPKLSEQTRPREAGGTCSSLRLPSPHGTRKSLIEETGTLPVSEVQEWKRTGAYLVDILRRAKEAGDQNIYSEVLRMYRLTKAQAGLLEKFRSVFSDTDPIDVAVRKTEKAWKQAAQMVLSGEVKTQTEAAELFDISRQAVSKAKKRLSTKMEDSSKLVDIPDHVTERHAIADFEKLSPEGQERVRQKEPLNRVAIEEGVRQPPDHLKLAKSHFLKMTAEQRTAFDAWRATR